MSFYCPSLFFGSSYDPPLLGPTSLVTFSSWRSLGMNCLLQSYFFHEPCHGPLNKNLCWQMRLYRLALTPDCFSLSFEFD